MSISIAFSSFPKRHECFVNSTETRAKSFQFLFENSGRKKETSFYFDNQSVNLISLVVRSLPTHSRQQLVLYRVIKDYFKPITARIFFGLFSNALYLLV